MQPELLPVYGGGGLALASFETWPVSSILWPREVDRPNWKIWGLRKKIAILLRENKPQSRLELGARLGGAEGPRTSAAGGGGQGFRAGDQIKDCHSQNMRASYN